MKRARPKNKKAAIKKLKEQEVIKKEQEAAESVDAEYDEIEPDDIKGVKPAKKGGVKHVLNVVFAVFAGLVILLFAAMGFGFFEEGEILAPLEDGKINVLLMGTDEEGLRTDAIMVASYDVNAAEVNILSIPRDTKVYVTNRKVTRKINEIHAMPSKVNKGEIVGSEAVAEAVTQLTGIPINYYAEFSFSAIDTLFDILGPVEFDVPDVEGKGRGMNYDDPYQNLHIHLKPGLQKLSGNQVQQFLRYRKSNYGVGTGSDTDRVARQQEFVKAVVDQKVNITILAKLPSIFMQISKEMKTNITAGDITKYIRYINKLSAESIHTYSLPGENQTIGGGSYFVCDLVKTTELVRDTFGFDAEVSDKITISDDHSQKVLKAGNKSKKTQTAEPEKTEKPEKSKEPTAPEPTKAPVVTKEPTKAPVVTKVPMKSPEPTKIPLEDLDDEYLEI